MIIRLISSTIQQLHKLYDVEWKKEDGHKYLVYKKWEGERNNLFEDNELREFEENHENPVRIAWYLCFVYNNLLCRRSRNLIN